MHYFELVARAVPTGGAVALDAQQKTDYEWYTEEGRVEGLMQLVGYKLRRYVRC